VAGTVRSVLDTSLLVRGSIEPLPGELAVSAASHAELHFGVLVAGDATTRALRLRRLVLVERLFEPLPVDDAVARAYGEVASAVVRAGRQPRSRVMDLLIAATALAHAARLYTANAEDLRGLEGLVEVVAV
jgi:predicted nucleic acid-binding protein